MSNRIKTYQAFARRLREQADKIEARCDPKTAREKAALTSAIVGALRESRRFADKHMRTTNKRGRHV